MAVAAQRRGLVEGSVGSVAIHALAALLIPALAWTPSTLPPVETISFVRVSHIELQPKREPQPPPRAQAPRFRAAPLITRAHHQEISHVTPRRVTSPPPSTVADVSGAPDTAPAARPGTGTAVQTAVVQATATPMSRAVASVGAHETGGYMPFTAEQPDPVLDPGVRKQLDALGVHVTIVVTVGEDGKTKNVEFQPPVDPQVESRIQSLLADASWDPAVCGGGIYCEGRATIRL
jgi:hypothetical protein